MVICVPGDPGAGVDYMDGYYHALEKDIANEGMVMALRDLDYHNTNDCIIVDLCFNTYTWMNDGYSLKPRVVSHERGFAGMLGYEATNVGKISLIGYGTSGYGVLSLLYRHPDVFHRAVSADAPIWGASANEGREVVRKEYLESLSYTAPKGVEMEEITPPGEEPKSKEMKAQEEEEDEEEKEEKSAKTKFGATRWRFRIMLGLSRTNTRCCY